MKIAEGDRFKHIITAHLYKVKIIEDGKFVLECEDIPNRWWIGDGDLSLFFKKLEKK